MKISNFRNVVTIPSKTYRSIYAAKADIDVTIEHRFLWWTVKTETETRQVFKAEYSNYWIWTDTGEWTPRLQVEQLYKAYCAQEEINRTINLRR